MTQELSDRQSRILDYIRYVNRVRGYPPSVREIGEAVGLSSSSTVHNQLNQLERRGYVKRDASKSRTVQLVQDAAAEEKRRSAVPVPVVGHVAAGQPILAEENVEEYIQTPPFAGGDEGEYLLRVRGESMKNIGILDGDLVVVRPQETASDGEVVVALVGEEATVKRFFQEADHVRLQPENETMEPIRTREVQVLGGVVGLMRSLP